MFEWWTEDGRKSGASARNLVNKKFPQLVRKFPVFYGTRKSITVFTKARQRSLCWVSWIQSTPSNPASLIHTLYCPSINVWVFRVVSFLQIFQPKFSNRVWSLPINATCPALWYKDAKGPFSFNIRLRDVKSFKIFINFSFIQRSSFLDSCTTTSQQNLFSGT
jgi:hypothetical protein